MKSSTLCACFLFFNHCFPWKLLLLYSSIFSHLYSTLRDSPNPGGGNRLSRNEKCPQRQENDFFSTRFSSCSKNTSTDRPLRPQFAFKSEQPNSERTRMCWRNNLGPPSLSPQLKKVLPNPKVSPHPNLPLQYGICPFHKSRSIGLVLFISFFLFLSFFFSFSFFFLMLLHLIRSVCYIFIPANCYGMAVVSTDCS